MKWELNFKNKNFIIDGFSELCVINEEILITDLGTDQYGNRVQIYWKAHKEWLENEHRAPGDFDDACDWDNPIKIIIL